MVPYEIHNSFVWLPHLYYYFICGIISITDTIIILRSWASPCTTITLSYHLIVITITITVPLLLSCTIITNTIITPKSWPFPPPLHYLIFSIIITIRITVPQHYHALSSQILLFSFNFSSSVLPFNTIIYVYVYTVLNIIVKNRQGSPQRNQEAYKRCELPEILIYTKLSWPTLPSLHYPVFHYHYHNEYRWFNHYTISNTVIIPLLFQFYLNINIILD